MESEHYSPASYWEQLLTDDFTLKGVGHPYLPMSFNRANYRAIERAMRRALGAATSLWPLEQRSVLDVGSGIGIWLDFWKRLLVGRLVGIDLTTASVAKLRERYPDLDLRQANVGVDDLGALGRFDVISVVNVFLHVTDDGCFRKAVADLGAILEPGGAMLVVDPVVVHTWWGGVPGETANSNPRSLADWQAALAPAGLRIEAIFPVTFLLDGPVDTRSPRTFRFLMAYWNILCRALHQNELIGSVLGAILYRLDAVMVRLPATGPSLKCLLIVPV
jgi:SAM-dependent methyltransferase